MGTKQAVTLASHGAFGWVWVTVDTQQTHSTSADADALAVLVRLERVVGKRGRVARDQQRRGHDCPHAELRPRLQVSHCDLEDEAKNELVF